MLEYLDDIASDMSVFHRVDDVGGMNARRFFRLAFRLPAYQGVMAARVARLDEREQAPARPMTRSAPTAPGSGGPAIAATTDVLRTNPAFAQIPGEAPVFTIVKGGGDGGR